MNIQRSVMSPARISSAKSIMVRVCTASSFSALSSRSYAAARNTRVLSSCFVRFFL